MDDSTKLFTRLLWLGVLLVSPRAFAIEVPTGTDDLTLDLTFELSVRAQGDWDGDRPVASGGASPNGTFNTDFYIKRARLIARGTGYKYFTFIILLDTLNFGIRGNYTGSTLLDELAIGFVPAKDFTIEVGLLLMPLSRFSLSASSRSNALDLPFAIFFYNNDRNSRETGIQIRTLLFDRRILIRGGAYEGWRGNRNPPETAPFAVNPSGKPLYAGILRLNLVGDEGASYAFPGIYCDGKSHVSVGVGGQYQNQGSDVPVTTVADPSTGAKSTSPTGVANYVALAVDAFVDIALPSDTEVAFQFGGYRFDWGAGSDKTGYGIAIEAGYRLGPIEPEVNGYWFNSDSRQNSFLKVAVGLNYFLTKHHAKITAEFASIKNNANLDATPALHEIVVQAQLYF